MTRDAYLVIVEMKYNPHLKFNITNDDIIK